MLGKIVLLGLGIWLILNLLNQYRRNIDTPTSAPTKNQDMVKCSSCGVHLPTSESIEANGKHYCCKEHMTQAYDR